ncbi:hypothetical protein B0O80DRAFT_453942 [Mortierella sp. GBAus27b]|nr:hypothetical protein B0O80DRAFT_453942 [Mortierella sp. GBAus27b]
MMSMREEGGQPTTPEEDRGAGHGPKPLAPVNVDGGSESGMRVHLQLQMTCRGSV